MTKYLCAHDSINRCLFPKLGSNKGIKHQNRTRLGTQTVPHDREYITLFLTLHDEAINDDNKKILTHQLLVSLAMFTFSHYNGDKMSAMASQITSLTIIYSAIYSGADQRKHQSSASLPFVWGIHQWTGNFPHKGPLTRKLFPFNDVIMLMKSQSVTQTLRDVTIVTQTLEKVISDSVVIGFTPRPHPRPVE